MLSSTRHSRRSGFALVTVLWVVATVAIIGASLTTSSREAVATAQNRIDLLRATWRAEACTEIARAVINDTLATDSPRSDETPVWSSLGRIVPRSDLLSGCDISLRPSGTTIDVNGDSARIRAVLTATGETMARADSLVSALLDWRDTDDTSRSAGAEEPWYSREHRPGPRNGPVASIDELRLVRGFDRIAGLDTLFGVEDERINLDAAPLAVLASLPGFGVEALAVIQEHRSRGVSIGDLTSLAALLPPTAKATLLVHYPELVQLTTGIPEAWTVTSRASAGAPPLFAAVELRLVNGGRRAATVRRRSWP